MRFLKCALNVWLLGVILFGILAWALYVAGGPYGWVGTIVFGIVGLVPFLYLWLWAWQKGYRNPDYPSRQPD